VAAGLIAAAGIQLGFQVFSGIGQQALTFAGLMVSPQVASMLAGFWQFGVSFVLGWPFACSMMYAGIAARRNEPINSRSLLLPGSIDSVQRCS
jgi:hypothetical protein